MILASNTDAVYFAKLSKMNKIQYNTAYGAQSLVTTV